MIRNEKIVCISSIDWDFIWQGHQEIMSTFAKNGNTVLFIDNTGVRRPALKDFSRIKKRLFDWLKAIKGFRKVSDNIFVYSPVILPFPYSRLARWINKFLLIRPLKQWMNIAGFYNPIIWTFLPTGIALDIIDSLEKKILIYYCIADFYELTNPKKIKKTEDELIRKSDLIFAQGDYLSEKCKQFNTNVYIFPFGVKIEIFDYFESSIKIGPEDIVKIKKPIIGYVGGLHKHVDFNLIAFIAKNNPNCSVVLIGPVQTDIGGIANLDNVYLLGKKDFSALPSYINQFDVGIIPYKYNKYTETVFPTKLNEYLALGKPAVSTALPEIIIFDKLNDGLVLIGRSQDEFKDCILKSLGDNDEALREKRIFAARKNSWSERIEKMSSHIEEILENRSEKVVDWQAKFLKIYSGTRRKFMGFSSVALAIYVILFYTPLIWLVANPLKISQLPEKADSVVVFAGGVGESGQAGQGFEERVKCAVDFYKHGYVDNLIFSSGYMYFYKEPVIMKALAVSLGVPENAIILETNSKSTYENVKFTFELLNKSGYKKILLVSSPYHMKRAALVFNKIAKGLDVIYTPAPNSLFYNRNFINTHGKRYLKKANLSQIRAIIHEYFSLIYYWLKGYI